MTPIKKLARRYGLSEEEVTRRINAAIKAGMESGDEKQRALWRTLFGQRQPTREEFIKTIARKILLGEI